MHVAPWMEGKSRCSIQAQGGGPGDAHIASREPADKRVEPLHSCEAVALPWTGEGRFTLAPSPCEGNVCSVNGVVLWEPTHLPESVLPH